MKNRDTKVVHLGRNGDAKKAQYGRQSAVLVDLQERGRQQLMGLLRTMFDNTDDALYELADKSDSNAEQNLFFESMREVRIKRRGVENGFSQAIAEAFRLISDNKQLPADGPVALGTVKRESLSLVEPEELEEQVAIDGMVSKAISHYPKVLAELTRRVDSLTNEPVSTENMPFGPNVVCRSFVASCEIMSIDIKAKLVVFKLFERFVANQLGEVLEECNQFLIRQGVAPSNNHSVRQPVQARANGGRQAAPGDVSLPDVDAVFNDLQRLLHPTSANANSGPSAGFAGIVPLGQAPVLPRNTMMELLSEIQYRQMEDWQPAAGDQLQGDNGEPASCLDVTHLLGGLLAEHGVDQAHSLGKVDDDVLNLVQMLFQFILEDRNLAVEMKALIGRLQIPMIKVALQDKGFFSRGGHPARKLLNEIATSALGWTRSDTGHDSYYEKVRQIVFTLLSQYENDNAIFQELLTDFQTFVDREKQRTTLVEKRIVDAEDGRAKSEVARTKVQALVNEKVAGLALPDVVVKLLREGWSNLLFLIYLREGVESEEWLHNVGLIDELLWSVQPPEAFQDRQSLLQRLPVLLKELRAGLTKINFNSMEMNSIFSELEAEHLKRLKAVSSVYKGNGAQASVHQAESSPVDIGADVNRQSDATVERHAETISEALHDMSVAEKLDSLNMGNWVEFHTSGEASIRCRLAAIIKPSGKYIFVNRSGKKVAEYQREELAVKIQSGQASVLDDSLLFDRALESVIGSLRDYKKR